MRSAIANYVKHHHVGLAYERMGVVRPAQGDETNYTRQRDEWLDALAASAVHPDYERFHYDRWRPALTSAANHLSLELELTSRLLIGHGNPSASEVGLTLHHTWGVPIMPGSAIKGVLAHHIAEHFGDRDDPERAAWAGVHYREGTIQAGPGEHYRRIFGAPDSRDEPQGASKGEFVFHDALYVPGSAAGDQPLARDVLTVHNKTYYDKRGERFPNDYDDPNPVAFLTVRPGVRFFMVIEGPAELLAIINRLLLEDKVLGESGVGGKTSLGYGRLHPVEPAPRRNPTLTSPPATTPPPVQPSKHDRESEKVFAAFLDATKERHIPEYIELFRQWQERLLALSPTYLKRLRDRLDKKRSKKHNPDLEAIIALVDSHMK